MPQRTRRKSTLTRPSTADRLWASVTKSDGCWEWTGYTKNGYGVMSVRNRPTYMHRFSFELANGPIADGLFVLHRCDNKKCVRPDHLFAGTQQDNVDDMHAKGRAVAPQGRFGLDNHKATKPQDVVERARSMRAEGVHQRVVAKALGVSQSTVWRWTHRHTRSS